MDKTNNIKFQTNPLYQEPSAHTGKAKGISGGMEVRETASELPKIEKKKSGFLEFFASIIRSFTSEKKSVVDAVKYQPLCDKLSEKDGKPFDATSLSKSDLLSGSYAMLKRASDKTNLMNVEGFQRGNDIGSKMRAELGKHDKVASIASGLAKGIKNEPVAVDNKSFAKLAKDMTETQKTALANTIAGRFDTVMTGLFGAPGNPDSTKKAAAKYPQALCDLLAIQFKAIDDSAAPQELKASMKIHLAKDVLALRSLNHALAESIAKLPKGEHRDNLMQLSKGIQSLVNNQGLSQNDLPEPLREKSAELSDIWSNQFKSFTDAIVARADPKTVAKHCQIGAVMVPNITDPPPRQVVKNTQV